MKADPAVFSEVTVQLPQTGVQTIQSKADTPTLMGAALGPAGLPGVRASPATFPAPPCSSSPLPQPLVMDCALNRRQAPRGSSSHLIILFLAKQKPKANRSFCNMRVLPCTYCLSPFTLQPAAPQQRAGTWLQAALSCTAPRCWAPADGAACAPLLPTVPSPDMGPGLCHRRHPECSRGYAGCGRCLLLQQKVTAGVWEQASPGSL